MNKSRPESEKSGANKRGAKKSTGRLTGALLCCGGVHLFRAKEHIWLSSRKGWNCKNVFAVPCEIHLRIGDQPMPPRIAPAMSAIKAAAQ